MFTWLNKQGVKSDRGFVVQRTGRFTAEYREHGKTVSLDVESGVNGGLPCIVIHASAFDYWDDDTEKILEAQRDEMFRNFKEAVEFQGLDLVIDQNRPAQY